MAPEMIETKIKDLNWIQDVFTFGIIAFEILFEVKLFDPTEKIYEAFNNCTYTEFVIYCLEKYQAYYFPKVSSLLLKLILACLNPELKDRPSPPWILIILRHLINLYIKL